MLRITQSVSAASAERYFEEGLARADYYAEGERELGYWGGKGAEQLGLRGEVSREDFTALVNGRAPDGTQLTARHDEDRRPGYDFTFSVPKSVSIYLAETGDKQVEQLIHEALAETMGDIEREMKTRVRKGGANHDRTTGNMMWAVFTHRVTRPVDGMPDPHFHMHAYVPNLTYDPDEKRWKAGQFGDIKRDAPFWEASFCSRLADKLQGNGIGIRRTEKGFELASIADSTIEKFSRRTRQIEEIARKETEQLRVRARSLMRERGLSYADALAEAKGQLGAQSRKAKDTGLSPGDLQKHWRSQMDAEELDAVRSSHGRKSENLVSARDAIHYAVLHTFERASVATERELAAIALKRGVGELTVHQVATAFRDASFIRREQDGRTWCTTRDVLREETQLIDMVRTGLGAAAPFQNGHRWSIRDEKLNKQQRAAVEHILVSTDRFTGVRGAAGTGKTTMMREATAAVEFTSGKKVFTFAPSAAAVDVLRADGFNNAETVQQLLVNSQLQDRVKGHVLWIDEAGLLGARQMHNLARFAETNGCRVIFSGDSAQHRAVERGDSLRLLETQAGLRVAELSEIQRQKNAEYRQAVMDLSEGRTAAGFEKLDTMGAVIEVSEREERIERLITEHLAAMEGKRSSLIVAPTHAEGREVTARIREDLKQKGIIGEEDARFTRLENLGWTEAQRADPGNYRQGMVVEFHQNARGFRRGEKWTVLHRDGERVLVANGERTQGLPLNAASRFSTYQPEEIGLATGDTVRITKNIMSADGKHRLSNGSLHRITAIEGDRITLDNGTALKGSMLHLAYGHTVTSHASQGKTVDQVLISQPAATFSVASREQFYVSVSRGRRNVKIFTDSKVLLQEAIAETEMRQSATELLQGTSPQTPMKDTRRTITRSDKHAQQAPDFQKVQEQQRTVERERANEQQRTTDRTRTQTGQRERGS